MAADPVLRTIGDSVWAVWPERATFEFSRIHEHGDTLSAELSVVSVTAGELSWARLNIASTQGRATLAKTLEEREPTEDWRTLVDRSCRLMAAQLRKGTPAVPLIAAPPETARWLVDGLIPHGQITVLCGDGGTGKSYLALTLALASVLQRAPSARWTVAPTQRVMYLDWESDRTEQQARLWGLAQGLASEPGDGLILHRTMRRPLKDEIVALRGEVATQNVDFVVADSLGPACGPEPETADAAVTTLLALRSLAVTVLVLAHVSKASADAKAPARPFGSVYVQNLARSVIEARRSEGDDDGGFTLSLYHRKSNHGRLVKPSALRFDFEPTGVVRVGPGEADVAGASLAFQILDVLKNGSKESAALIEALDCSPGTLRSALSRLEKRGMVTRLGDAGQGRGNKSQWALLDTKRGTKRGNEIDHDALSENGDDPIPF